MAQYYLKKNAIAYDMIECGQSRYNLMGNGGHWFPGYKADILDKHDISDAIRLSPHRDKIPQALKEADNLLSAAEVKRLSQS